MKSTSTNYRLEQPIRNKFKPHKVKIKHKFRFVFFLTIVFVFIISLSMFVKTYAQNSLEPTLHSESHQKIIVQSGESLWVIASLFKPEEVSMNTYIRKIKEINKLTSSTIHEGEILYLP